MSFRSLLVLLDGEAPCAVRSHLAARMAAAHASHLIGLAPTGPLDFLPSLAGASHSIEEVDAARAGALDRASRWTERVCGTRVAFPRARRWPPSSGR